MKKETLIHDAQLALAELSLFAHTQLRSDSKEYFLNCWNKLSVSSRDKLLKDAMSLLTLHLLIKEKILSKLELKIISKNRS